MTVGEVAARLSLDDKEYKKGLKKAEGVAKSSGAGIGSIFKNAFSVTLGMGMFEALKKGFKSTVSTAISFNSMLQTASIGFATMLGSAEKAQGFLEDMADFAVRTPFEYPDLLEAAKRMLAYGFAADEVLPTLRAVGDAAAALGSGNVGIERITLALGQIQAKGKLSAEEMRQLTEAGVPAWHMLAEAMGTTVPALQDMVSKGLVPGGKAVEMLTNGMTKRFGGMMSSMENTWQGVTSSIKDIWRMTIGTLTSNLFSGLNSMLIKVRDFLSSFYSMLQTVMGKKAKQTTDSLVESTNDQAEAMSDVGDASEEAAKQAKKNLQVFDEVHQLQEDMSDTAAGDMFPVANASTIVLPEIEETGESDTVTKMQTMLEKLKVLFDPAIESFNRLKETAEPIITNIGNGLKWFWDNVLVPYGTWVINDAVPAFFNLLTSAVEYCGSAIDFFKPLALWLWDNFLKPIAEWTGGAIVSVLDGLSTALSKISDWMTNNSENVSGFTEKLKGFADVWDLIKQSVELAGEVLSDMWESLTKSIGDFIENNGGELEEFANNIVKFFTTAWLFLKIQWELFLGILDGIWKGLGKPIFEGVVQDILTILGGIIKFINGIFSGDWQKAWKGIGEVFKGIIEGNIKIFFGFVNFFVDGINALIRGLNKISIKVPDWVAKLLGMAKGETFGFNIKELVRLELPKNEQAPSTSVTGGITRIPQAFAQGTNYIPQDMFAYLHEGEAVVPKKYNPDAAGITPDTLEQAVYRAFTNALRIMQASAKQDDKDLVLKIDNTILARMQLPAIIREGQRQGLNLAIQGV